MTSILLLTFLFAPVAGWAADAQHDCEHAGEKMFASPDGRWVATVREEVCAIGNTTGAGIMVDLALAADAAHAKRVFNMRVPRSRDLWPRVVWTGPMAMELWAPNRADIMAQESQFDGVRIQLKYCGDNPAERAQVAEYQTALKQWMKDTTEWARKRKQDPSFSEARPKRPAEPTYSSDSCANVG
ncbi:MAG: hypothetical protein WDO68_08025 [Gammaproteobacteria bacterium]